MSIKFIDSSNTFKTKAKKQLSVALHEMGFQATEEAVALAPVDTGRLKGSINAKSSIGYVRSAESEFDTIRGTVDPKDVIIGTNVIYAPHVEYGTKFSKSQSFLRRGMENAKPKFKKIIEHNKEKIQ